jgi:tRNA pseudouridine38-40 synthase
MPHFRLTLAYDGTAFVGWQRQASGTSVQALVEDALARLDERAVAVTSAGRTDAGVHALGQVASFTLVREIAPRRLVRALNFYLPPEVRALAASVVAPAFHARFDARAKLYRYQIWNGTAVPPMWRRYVWQVPIPLDVAAMDAAASHLVGRHDFAVFQSAGTEVADTRREIHASRVFEWRPEDALEPAAGMLLRYEVEGDGFLRHMVRAIAGTLVEVGRGRRAPGWMSVLLESHDRAAAGRTAPPEGLCLVRVTY